MRRPRIQHMKASQVRQEWSQVLNSDFRGEQRVLVEKSGIPVAAIVSTEHPERVEQFEVQWAERMKVLEASWTAFKDEDPEDLEQEVARAVTKARQDLRREKERAVQEQ